MLRRGAWLVLCLFGFGLFSAAYAADDDKLVEALAAYQGTNGVDWARVRKAYESKVQAQMVPTAARLEAKPNSTTPQNDPAEPERVTEDFRFFLRKDFADVHLFQAPLEVLGAKGASVAWWEDDIANDRAWSGDGMLAAAYTFKGDYKQPGDIVGILGVTVVPFLQVARENHSTLDKKDRNVLTLGGSAEIGFDLGNSYQFLRFSGRDIRDELGDKHIASGTLEWLPVYKAACIGHSCPIPGLPIISNARWMFHFAPELKAQAEKSRKGGALIFSGEDEALRLGPEASLAIFPFRDPGAPASLFDLSRLSLSATYAWAYESQSDRDFEWFTASLIYHIDEKGNFALTAGYQNGNDQNTGEDTDLFKITAAGKF